MNPKDKKQKPKQPQASVSDQVLENIVSTHPSHNDPQGSYTGRPVNPYEVPVQDADDL